MAYLMYLRDTDFKSMPHLVEIWKAYPHKYQTRNPTFWDGKAEKNAEAVLIDSRYPAIADVYRLRNIVVKVISVKNNLNIGPEIFWADPELSEEEITRILKYHGSGEEILRVFYQHASLGVPSNF